MIPYLLPIFIFLGVAIALFPDVFQGKTANQPDQVISRGKENEAKKFFEKTGENTLWTNSLFSGMPTFYVSARYEGNLLKKLHSYVLTLNLPKPANYFFLGMLSAFIFFLVLGINPWLCMTGALAMGLCSYNFVIFEAGHDSKFLAIAYFPMVAAGVILAYRNKFIEGALLFALSFGLLLWTSHMQMIYYLGIVLLIYVLTELVSSLKNGSLPSFVKASLFLLLGLVLAFGSNASRLISSKEYVEETIRGKQILQGISENSGTSGLDKDYVFNWSHGITETLTFIVPSFMGGASSQPISKSSETYKDLKRKGANGDALKYAPLYWGAMPMTSGPVYFGAIMIFLFLLGAIVVRGSMKWWLLISSLLIILLSFGKNMMWFSDIFYYYFPLYDKFRAVSSILAALQLTIPTLGILGLWHIVSGKVSREFASKAVLISAAVTGGICLFLALVGPGIFDFAGSNDGRYGQAGYNVNAFITDRKSILRSDAFRSFALILGSAGILYVYLKESIAGNWKKYLVYFGLPLLVLFDMAGVGKRYLNEDNFVNKKRYENQFTTPRSVDKQILQDPDIHYRVHDLSISSFNSNEASRVHKTIGGYHAVKLRRYQDLIEKHIGMGNQKVLNMLNMKYIINQERKAQQNPGAMGNAWLVSNIQKVADANAEINALNSFEPTTTAVVHQEFNAYLNGLSPDGQGSINLTDYAPNKLVYKSNSTSDQMAVFSEVWYNPGVGKGWQAYIDGQAVDHIRANYILRALKVPAGEHEIVFEFKPGFFQTGEMISLGSSGIVILLGLAWFGMKFMKRKENDQIENA